MANKNLTNAKIAKKDEFYTRGEEIEKEVNAYLEYNKNVFRDKTILLPADDPFESNFFKFFAVHFNDFGLKRLIKTIIMVTHSKKSAEYSTRTILVQDGKII